MEIIICDYETWEEGYDPCGKLYRIPVRFINDKRNKVIPPALRGMIGFKFTEKFGYVSNWTDIFVDSLQEFIEMVKCPPSYCFAPIMEVYPVRLAEKKDGADKYDEHEHVEDFWNGYPMQSAQPHCSTGRMGYDCLYAELRFAQPGITIEMECDSKTRASFRVLERELTRYHSQYRDEEDERTQARERNMKGKRKRT